MPITEGGPDILLNTGALAVVLETMEGSLDNVCKSFLHAIPMYQGQ